MMRIISADLTVPVKTQMESSESQAVGVSAAAEAGVMAGMMVEAEMTSLEPQRRMAKAEADRTMKMAPLAP